MMPSEVAAPPPMLSFSTPNSRATTGSSPMDQVFFSFYCKLARACLRKTSTSFRSFLEHCVLLLAVGSFCVVIVAHKTFVYKPMFQQGSASYSASMSTSIPCGCLRNIPNFDPNAHVTTIILRHNTSTVDTNSSILLVERSEEEQQSPLLQLLLDTDRMLYSYSQTKGYLLLPPHVRKKHGITTQYVLIHTSDKRCFGGDHQFSYVMRSFVRHVLEDTIVMNWLLALHNGNGYILHLRNQHLVDLRFASDHLSVMLHHNYNNDDPHHLFLLSDPNFGQQQQRQQYYYSSAKQQRSYFRFIFFKCGVLLINLLVFCVTTTLVSFTLRQTQQRMVQFTFLLQLYIRNRVPIPKLIFTHVVESLVFVPITCGILLFLIEIFLENQLLAILVLSIVWICEVFSAISMRTQETTRFFPKVFFLYFTLFNVYFFSCPFGFSQLSLLSTALFLTHTMLFFWNRFELPAFQSGMIHSARQQGFQYERLLAPSTVSMGTTTGTSGNNAATVATASRANGTSHSGSTTPPLHPLFYARRSLSNEVVSNNNNNSIHSNTTEHISPQQTFPRSSHVDGVRRRRTSPNTTNNGNPSTTTLFQSGSSSTSLNTRVERESRGGNELLYFSQSDDEADYYFFASPNASPPLLPYNVQQ